MVSFFNPNGGIVQYKAQINGYNNPICVGIGHNDSQYNLLVKWSGLGGQYPQLISGTAKKGLDGNHGCVACAMATSPQEGIYGFWAYWYTTW